MKIKHKRYKIDSDDVWQIVYDAIDPLFDTNADRVSFTLAVTDLLSGLVDDGVIDMYSIENVTLQFAVSVDVVVYRNGEELRVMGYVF